MLVYRAMDYETVLFDWDGCLSMTLGTWLGIYKIALSPYGLRLSDIEIMTYAGNWDKLEELGIYDVMDFRTRINWEAASRFPSIPLYPSVKPLLMQLSRQGVKLGLVTSSERSDIEAALSYHELTSIFEIVVCGDDVSKHKPHPESILKAVEMLEANPKFTLMVGDSTKDIHGAANAKVDSALIFHDSHQSYYSFKELRESKPTHIFYSFDELLSFFRFSIAR